MMRYDTYKDSGVEWLGHMPEHWNVLRIKDITTTVSKGTTPTTEGARFTDEGIRFLKAENISESGKILDKPEIYISLETHNLLSRSKLKESDILIVIAGATTGKTAILKSNVLPANTNQAVCFLRLKSNYKESTKFIDYQLSSCLIQSIVWLYAVTSAQPNLPMGVLSRFGLFLPPLPEQEAIAQYLDTKTQAIDKKISLLEKKIDYYTELRKSIINDAITKGLDKNVELKDSGIDWIGQIPKHWEVKRFKEAVRKYTTGGTPSTSNTSYFVGDNIWVCIGDIDDKNIVDDSKIKLTAEAIKDANIIKTPKGSLLYSFKLSIGKMAFANCDLYTNEAILSIFPNKKIDLMFFYFMLPKYMDLASTENIYGAKMLNQKLIANALLVQPTVKEQTEIAQYLDDKTSSIDAIVTNIGKQIDHLQKLRKTLINDVVTGKIKVVE